MKKIDYSGILLCERQAEAFELSVTQMNISSEMFIRRFVFSNICKLMDDLDFLQTNYMAKDILDFVNEEYGTSKYGSKKYSAEEMYWIGYIYRYFSYTREWSSRRIYKFIKPKELRELYPSYHSLDPGQTVERLLESKGYPATEEGEMLRQYRILREVREMEKEYKTDHSK